MGELHDESATLYGDHILARIRAADDNYAQVFSTSLVRTGDWDWPRPDYVCFDEVNSTSYALEFMPPFQSKREYLTGLGQAIAYLQKHTYSGLIVPYLADDGFRIAEFLSSTLNSSEFENIGTSLFAYDYNTQSIDILRQITVPRSFSPTVSTPSEVKTFWCWWRDLSHYELYDLLNLSFIYADEPGDIYSSFVYPTFYRLMVEKKTKQWDGTPRNKSGGAASMRAEKQNYRIPLVQLELWSRSEGRLTELGFELLELGKKYGPNSRKFVDRLSYLILVNGRHLDLINLVDKYQKATDITSSSKEHAVELERFLSDNGCIGKRKPTAIKTGAKSSYMRDEMKLWNKLGLLYANNKMSYFFPGVGYKFNWERITEILIAGNR